MTVVRMTVVRVTDNGPRDSYLFERGLSSRGLLICPRLHVIFRGIMPHVALSYVATKSL